MLRVPAKRSDGDLVSHAGNGLWASVLWSLCCPKSLRGYPRLEYWRCSSDEFLKGDQDEEEQANR